MHQKPVIENKKAKQISIIGKKMMVRNFKTSNYKMSGDF